MTTSSKNGETKMGDSERLRTLKFWGKVIVCLLVGIEISYLVYGLIVPTNYLFIVSTIIFVVVTAVVMAIIFFTRNKNIPRLFGYGVLVTLGFLLGTSFVNAFTAGALLH